MLAFNNVLNGSGEMKNTANRKKNKREDRKQIPIERAIGYIYFDWGPKPQ